MPVPNCPLCGNKNDVWTTIVQTTYHCRRCNKNFVPKQLCENPIPTCANCGSKRYVYEEQVGWYCQQCTRVFSPGSVYEGYLYGHPIFYKPLGIQLQEVDTQIQEGKIVYIIMNSGLQIMSPVQSGFYKHKAIDPQTMATQVLALDDKNMAIEFAEFMASKQPGQRYYLFEMVDFVQTVEPPLKWSKK